LKIAATPCCRNCTIWLITCVTTISPDAHPVARLLW
jgi:hypothetical protein